MRKIIKREAGERVMVWDGSWSFKIDEQGKLVPSYGIAMRKDSPMTVIARIENLPTDINRLYLRNDIPKNNLLLKGKSGAIYFSHERFVDDEENPEIQEEKQRIKQKAYLKILISLVEELKAEGIV